MIPSGCVEIIDWGLIDYREALSRQENLVEQIIKKETSEKLIVCSHPPIVTLGRGTKPGDVFAWQGDTVEVNRGGRATYHGPSQIVLYPLIYLGDEDTDYTSKKIPHRDLHAYMRTLEKSVQLLLEEMDIVSQAQARQKQVGADAEADATGVWVGDQKIAAIGIAVKKWITSHGIALNVQNDLQAFQGFYPCGFKTSQVTSLEKLLGKKIDRSALQKRWIEFLQKQLF